MTRTEGNVPGTWAGDVDCLVADTGSPPSRIAIQVASSILAPISSADYSERTAYENLIVRLPAKAELAIVVEETDRASAEQWFSQLIPGRVWTIVPVPSGSLAKTVWMRDAFLCVTGSGTTTYLKTRIAANFNQADWLAASDGNDCRDVNIHLDGGDCLVGLDGWLVAIDSIKQTARIHGCSTIAAQGMMATIDQRPMRVAGFRYTTLKAKWAWLLAKAKQMVEEAETASLRRLGGPTTWLAPPIFIIQVVLKLLKLLTNPNELHQEWRHLDLVLSVTGVKMDDNGKEVVLVASTTMPPASRDDAEVEMMGDCLDALASHLVDLGYDVRRNPAPYASVLGSPRRILPYNNVIVQNDPNVVWLPQLALPDGTFADADRANLDIWEGLGFRVIQVAGLHVYVAMNGSLRCLTKTLARA
jgi:hypothetical protein